MNMDSPKISDDLTVAKRISHVIFKHAARISQESDFSKLLYLNADLARDLTASERCSIWLIDADTGEMWTKVAHNMAEIRVPPGTGVVGACVLENRTIIVNDTSSDERFLRRVDDTSGYHTESLMAVPLRAEGRVIGAMQVLNKPGGFSEHDAELLNFMALYSASEIQSERFRQEAEAARLLSRELELAREVQQNLLPRELDPVTGIEYEGFSRPAKSVGGDYYDFVASSDGQFSFTLGDVAGKGMPAAVLMASIQTLFRSHLLRRPLSLLTLFDEINQTIYRCSSLDRYSTLFCGVLDLKREKLSYVNAGHPAPMILRRDARSVERIEGAGLPIGLFLSSQYEERTVEVHAGDLIVSISDGISEAFNAAGTMWDERQVEEILLEYRNESVGQIIAAIIQQVDQYAIGTEQYDDMTVSILRITT
jgi:phosphoserine phosphatase RsbU/P